MEFNIQEVPKCKYTSEFVGDGAHIYRSATFMFMLKEISTNIRSIRREKVALFPE